MSDNEQLEQQLAGIIDSWVDAGGDATDADAVAELLAVHPGQADELSGCLDVLAQLQQSKADMILDADPRNDDFKYDAVGGIDIPGFDIVGVLGRGGMGGVYDAVQQGTNRSVALKALPLGSVNPGTVQRFIREAELAATLVHPHIVPVYAVGQHNGLHWFAMQKIEGVTLAQWLDAHDGPAPLDRVLAIGIAAADALATAHAKGIVHRDVKPGNLLIDEKPESKRTRRGKFCRIASRRRILVRVTQC